MEIVSSEMYLGYVLCTIGKDWWCVRVDTSNSSRIVCFSDIWMYLPVQGGGAEKLWTFMSYAVDY